MTKPVLIVAIKRAVVGHLGILLEAGLTRRRSCQAPVGVGRFVIRATHERGVGVPSSRSLATASREARSFYGNNRRFESCRGTNVSAVQTVFSRVPKSRWLSGGDPVSPARRLLPPRSLRP